MITTFTVPTVNLIGIVFSLLIAFCVPIGLCIFIRKKYRADLWPFFLGGGTFFLFAMVLERLFHLLVLFHLGKISDLLAGNIWLYAAYGGLAAALFEETGRLLTMKFLMKKNLNRENALMYGMGHGGFEAILILGIVSINNLVSSIMINSGTLLDALPAETDVQQIMETLSPLATLPAWQFYMGGFERLMAMAIQVAFSLLVYQSVRYRNKKILFFLAFLFHFLIDMTVVLIADQGSVIAAEISTLIGTIVIWVITWYTLKMNER